MGYFLSSNLYLNFPMKQPKVKASHSHPILSLKKAKIAGAKRTAFESHHMLYRAEMNIMRVVGKSGFFFFCPSDQFQFSNYHFKVDS